MSNDSEKKTYKHHPIQLLSINVRELYIRVNYEPKDFEKEKQQPISLYTEHNPYDEKNHTIKVSLRLDYGMEDKPKTPFSMRIDLFGEFIIDESKFSKEHIDDWAKKNAQFILFPYLREHAYSLSIRCGLPPAMLPLTEVPTFSLGKKNQVEKNEKAEP